MNPGNDTKKVVFTSRDDYFLGGWLPANLLSASHPAGGSDETF